MAGFVERFPTLVSPNPGGTADPLGESILDPLLPGRRVFEPAAVSLVLGRHQDPQRELLVDQATADGLPIYRRVAGGGAVVLAPGSVVVAQRLPKTVPDSEVYFSQMNAALIPVITKLAGVTPVCRGHGDLALPDAEGECKKILGASLRQTAQAVYYLGVFLVDDLVPLMQRYLAMPSRQPAYRADRGHAVFCTHLSRHGVAVADLIEATDAACAVAFDD